MSFLPFSYILRLRRELEGTGAEISTWGYDSYDSDKKQWSATCNTHVVSRVKWHNLLYRY